MMDSESAATANMISRSGRVRKRSSKLGDDFESTPDAPRHPPSNSAAASKKPEMTAAAEEDAAVDMSEEEFNQIPDVGKWNQHHMCLILIESRT